MDQGAGCRIAGDDRAQWIAILEAVSQSPPDELNDEWDWLLDQLGLPAALYLAVLETIKQGRWRKARNPRAYVKTVAKREAIKMGLSPNGKDDLVLVDPAALGQIAFERGSSDAIKGSDGVWRKGECRDEDWEEDNWRSGFDSFHDYLLSRLPVDLKVISEPSAGLTALYNDINASTNEHYLHLRPRVKPNWKKWAKRAGFDKSLVEQADTVSRKALQAAWRRFDRSGMRRLLKVLKINSSKNVPE
jgi:hypothetical protein